MSEIDNARSSNKSRSSTAWNLAALGLSASATAGSLYLSLGLGLKACPLCFYQRTFAIAVVLVLVMLLWMDGLRSSRACLAVLPLAASGLGVAGFHVYLVQVGTLECPPAVLGLGDGPLQSLAVFAALTGVGLAGSWSARREGTGGGWLPSVIAVLLGTIVAWACIASAPPLPPAPSQPYDPAKQPFDMCRPPFRGA